MGQGEPPARRYAVFGIGRYPVPNEAEPGLL